MLPTKLHYQSKVEPAMAKSFRSNIAPQNGTGGYNPGDTIVLNLPTRNNLVFVPTESYLKFSSIITNNSGNAANYYRFDSNGAHGFIRKIRIFHGSNLIEDIDNYDMLSKMMFDLQAPYDAVQGKMSITSGTRPDLSSGNRTFLQSELGTVDALHVCTMLNSVNNKVTTPNQGALLNSSTALVANAGTIQTQMYCINLISIIGSLCNEKYFPLFACTSGPLRVEITLVPSLFNAICTDQAGKFQLNDVEYVLNTIELSDSAMAIIQDSLQGEPLQFCVTDYKNCAWNGALPSTAITSFSVPINAKFSSLKSIIICTRDTSKCGNATYFPSSSNSFGLSQYYFRIGASVVPAKYPASSAEYFSEVCKSIGSIGDMYHTSAIDIDSYTQLTPQINNDLFTLGSGSTAGANNTFQFSNTSSGSFYTGIDLENYATADRTSIFAGYNSNTDDIFYTPTYPSQTAIGNIRFDSFAMYDGVLVFQNNTVYVKY